MTGTVRLVSMPIARRTVLRLSLLALVLGALAQAPPALASCAPPEPLDQMIANSDVVIVGTVTALTNSDRWARVQVEEIWKGGLLPAIVEVHGGGADPNMFTSVDRTYVPGRYLFTLYRDGTALSDNACSGTTEWGDDLAAFRPSDWTGPDQENEPTPSGLDLGFLVPLVGIALVGVVLIGGAWFISRSRENG